MAVPHKQKNGRFRVQMFLGYDPITDKRRYKSFSGKTRKECQNKYDDFMNSIGKVDTQNMTVYEALSGYITASEKRLQKTTIDTYNSLLENHYKQLINKPITDITKQDIDNLISGLHDRSIKTQKNVISLLFSALKHYGVELNYKVRISGKPRKETVIPSEDEIKSITELLLKLNDKDFYSAFILASKLGLRAGEICGLNNEDITCSVSRNGEKTYQLCVTKSRAMTKTGEITKVPKTPKSQRIIPISEELYNQLKNGADEDRICRMNVKQLSGKWRRFISKHQKELGLEHKYTFHSLRHYFTSMAIAQIANIAYVSSLLGHSQITTTLNTYTHVVKGSTANEFENKFLETLKI